MSKQSPSERLFTLTCALMAAPVNGVSKSQLVKAVAGYSASSSQEALDRMFERDKTSLKEAGLQLELIDGEGSEDPDATRYRIASGSFDWPKDLALSSKQLQLLELAARAWNDGSMRAVASSALTRLRHLGLVGGEPQFTHLNPRLLAKHPAFAPLSEAIAESLQVSFSYRRLDGEASKRVVSPIKLRLLQEQWVLLAQDNGQIKNFLLRRIQSAVSLLEATAELPDSALIAAAEADLESFVARNRTELELVPQTEAWWHFGAPTDSTIVVNFMDEELFAEELRELGSGVRVLSPASLANRVRAGLARVVSDHA